MKNPENTFATNFFAAVLLVVLFVWSNAPDPIPDRSVTLQSSDNLEKAGLLQNPFSGLSPALYGKPFPLPLSLGHACLSQYAQAVLPNALFPLLSKTCPGLMVPLFLLYHLVNIHAP